MYEMTDDNDGQEELAPSAAPVDASDAAGGEAKLSQADRELVKRILKTIKADKKHHDKAFKRMKRSMFMAMHGRDTDWSEKNYKANITGRHVRVKTNAIYAKNPKVVARRGESMDFTVWDETQQSLLLAMQTVQQLAPQVAAMQEAAAALPPVVNPETGVLEPQRAPLPPEYEQAMAVVADFQQGMQRRMLFKKLGRTLEIVASKAMKQQTPLDFKASMKQVVRRACTTGVGYVEVGFQKEFGVPPATTQALADFRSRMEHIRRLAEEAAEDKIGELDAEMAELQASVTALEQQEQIVLRSGLTFDFHQSSKIIPDRLTTSLVGFVGARHLTVEYLYTVNEVKEIFDVDLGHRYVPYTIDGKRGDGHAGVDMGDQDDFAGDGVFSRRACGDDLVCVLKHYDKAAGLVYWLCDGYDGWLRPPAAPEVTVPTFWAIYPVTFNGVESEDELFPKSDVELIADMQNEINRSRQGKREHRDAARPRWGYSNGALDEEDVEKLQTVRPFEAIQINKGTDTKLEDLLEAIPVPGVDPNLYDTNEVFMDAQMTVGTQAAQLGGIAKATATEAAIAEGSSSSDDGSSIDDLETCLTAIWRAGGQILMTNMSKDEVVRIAGPGAVWVEDLGLTPEDIFEEVYLEVEAGSTGKPNQALEIRNMKEVGPLLMQVGAIPPEWLARDFLRRYDDRLDLTEAVVSGIPAIVAMNRNAQPATGDAATDPNAQGDKGGDKVPAPGGPAGSDAPMGNNQNTVFS